MREEYMGILQKIKNWLPPTSQTFFLEMNKMCRLIEELSTDILHQEQRHQVEMEKIEQIYEKKRDEQKKDFEKEKEILFNTIEEIQIQLAEQNNLTEGRISSLESYIQNQEQTLCLIKGQIEESENYIIKAIDEQDQCLRVNIDKLDIILQKNREIREELNLLNQDASIRTRNFEQIKEVVQLNLQKWDENEKKIYDNIEKQEEKINHLLEIVKLLENRNAEEMEGINNWNEVGTRNLKLINEISSECKMMVKELNENVKNNQGVLHELFEKKYLKSKIFYGNIAERNALTSSFKSIMEDENLYENKLQSLLRGLDEQSKSTICRILIRMSLIIDGNKKPIDLFTEDEQNMLMKMHEDFETRIIKVSKNMYCYNGYLLPVNQFDSSVFYSKYGMEYIENLDTISRGDIIDIGGYVGDTALLFSPMTNRKVYVFEASPSSYDIIQQTIKMNNLENIIVENIALGKENCTMQFSLSERSSCNSLIERTGYVYTDKIDVQVLSLDQYVSENNVQVSLIKMDVEGAEQLVLDGATETIKKYRPTLLISMYHSAADFFEIKPLIENLGLGYKFTVFKPVNKAIVMETVLIAEVVN